MSFLIFRRIIRQEIILKKAEKLPKRKQVLFVYGEQFGNQKRYNNQKNKNIE